MLGFLFYNSMIGCNICLMDNQLVPHVRVDTFSYFPNLFFISNICSSYDFQIYIIVDILLYFYTLPINHISYFSQVFA